jgi:protease-4
MYTTVISCFLILSSHLSIATTDDALANLTNPGGLSFRPDLNFYYLFESNTLKAHKNHTILAQLGNIGIGYLDLKKWRFSLSQKLFNNVGLGVSFTYGAQKNFWNLGLMARPRKFLSAGVVMESISKNTKPQYLLGLGIRPFSDRITFTVDLNTRKLTNLTLGVETELLNGIELNGRYPFDQNFSLKLGISQGKLGLGTFYQKQLENFSPSFSSYFRISKNLRRKLIRSPQRFLELTLTGKITEEKSSFSLLGSNVSYTTYELLTLLHRAQTDPEIQGIILKLYTPQMSLPVVQELKSLLDKLKNAQKKIITYAHNLSTLDYYLVCNAHKIIIHPLGEVAIPGVIARATLLKNALDKLGLEVEYERIGRYKNAPEYLTEESLSIETQEVLNNLLDNFYQDIVETFAQGRNKSQEEIEEIINEGFFSAPAAKNRGLIDELCYEDELDSIITKLFGKYSKISQGQYKKEKPHRYLWDEPQKFALVYISGEITTGKSTTNPLTGSQSCGAQTIAHLIRKAKTDNEIKAIILRIDSPGGDGFASDLIWREIMLAKKTKPVIISMAQVAASGGYYIAIAADKIFALPATITGSIGVFSMKLVTTGLYEKLGIKEIILKRGEHADMYSNNRKFTDEERTLLKEQLQRFYDQFLAKVSRGRNLSKAYVDSVGQGKIWLGKDAVNLKLVDFLGGIFDAVEYLKTTKNLKEAELIVFSPKKSWTETLTGTLLKMLFE